MASILCRNGETFPNSHRHTSVAEVRTCQRAPQYWEREKTPQEQAREQLKAKLAALKASPLPGPAMVEPAPIPGLPGVTTAGAETMSQQMGTFEPKRGTVSQPAAGGMHIVRVDPALEARVPAGRYAIVQPDGLKFYRVEKPTKGAWAGRTFVKVQASDELYPIRSAASRAQILEKIAADPRRAAVLYGIKLGVCGVCGRTLTDEDSIKAGIGPVCAKRMEFPL